MKTDDLIDRLVNEGGVVRPLPPPWRRAAAWLLLTAVFTAVVVWAMSPRPDLAAAVLAPRFLLEQGLALITAVTAAIAAFSLVIPGLDSRVRWVPLVPASAWIGTLGLGCAADWFRSGAAGLRVTPEPECLFYIALIGSLPAVVFVGMLHRGVPLFPRSTVTLAGLAAAAMGAFGLRLFHVQDAALMILIWQAGSVLLLSALAGLAGPLLLRWGDMKRESIR